MIEEKMNEKILESELAAQNPEEDKQKLDKKIGAAINNLEKKIENYGKNNDNPKNSEDAGSDEEDEDSFFEKLCNDLK